MATKTKTFDCVTMKNEIQARLLVEYKARRGEFPSYADFVAATVKEHPWCRRQLKRMARPTTRAHSCRP